jgi:acylphosphatase
VRIEGRVQGVGFRYWTEQTAVALGLCGWVRNRRDASVEALLAGPPEVVARMLELCRKGPPGARVDALVVLEYGSQAPPGFEVWPTV